MPLTFRKQFLSARAYESAGIADVNLDGVPDIVCGAWWYQGPNFRTMHKIWDPPTMGDYFDDFSTIFVDSNGNGFPDIITGGWGSKTLFLLLNPGHEKKPWEVKPIATRGSIETTRAWDIDGDGELEIIPNLPNGPLYAYKLKRSEQGTPTGEWSEHLLWQGPQGHGLGFGDVDGDGRGELVTCKGILKQPESGPWAEPWNFQPTWEMERPSIPILVVDLDEDGHNELIAGCAHSYGLNWYKRNPQTGQWITHPIDPFQSQYHDLHWLDLDGCGKPELITGKRYWAHCGSDPGESDPLAISCFKWTGENFARQIIDHGPLGIGKGTGIHMAAGDLNGNGKIDLVAPGKDGLAIYWNETP